MMRTDDGRAVVGVSYSAAGYESEEWMPEDENELLVAVKERVGEVGGVGLQDSPLLSGLLHSGESADVFATLVLPSLTPTDLAMFACVSTACQAAVVRSGLPRAGTINVKFSRGTAESGVFCWQPEPLDVLNFVGSAAMLQ
jgi:hypothetical protein